MPIDYEKIRSDNVEEYGKGTRHLAFFERLYSDGTHFIFELLQNAEDAKATRIEFRLFDDQLEVRHDGRSFDEKDVRGVCGVGETTKEDDFTQIGRFGIGFKSVYAFTKTPAIHCGEEHFEIRNYVRPYAIEARSIEEPWTTLIVIPLGKDDVPADFAKDEIGNRLRSLSARTLLFLANIAEIEYRIDGGATGTYLKSTEKCLESDLVTVIGESSESNGEQSEYWLVFQKPIVHDEGQAIVPPAQIAFLLEDRDSKSGSKRQRRIAYSKPWEGKAVKALNKSPLVVFFPTEKDSQLGFLVQGAYRTTPARDNVPPHDEWNQSLIRVSASLLVESALPALKEMDLLTVRCFEALPIDMDDFAEDDFFFPIADAVRNALQTNELLPAADGTFISGQSAILGRGEDLRGLLDGEQLAFLFDFNHDVKWLSGDITGDKSPTLRNYLRDELEIVEVTPDSLVAKLSAEFMERQSDTWTAKFYGCLLGWEALWKPRRQSWGRSSAGSLREREFLRLEDGSHVAPFDEDGHPNAYLPLKGPTQVPIVKRTVASDKAAKEFLTRLGLSEPDVVAEVIEEVLPLYLSVESLPSVSANAAHMKEILAAWSTDSMTNRQRLEERLKESPFVRYHCRSTGNYGYAEPTDVYFPSDNLLRYFDGNEEAKFVVTSYPKDVRDMLVELGVEDVPRCFEVAYGDPPYKKYSTRGSRIENYILDGLEEFLGRLVELEELESKKEMALILWNYLLAYADSDDNCFQATRYYFYYSASRQTYDALFVSTLRETEWLTTSDGRFAKPPNMSIDQLPNEFQPNQKLVSALDIQPDPSHQAEEEQQTKRLFASQLGIDLEDAEFIRNNRDEFEQLRQTIQSRVAHQEEIENSPSRNRERRRQKLKERRERAPTKESVMKLRSVPGHSSTEIDRQTLFDFYRDEDESVFCQMCLDPMPFVRRNGEECGECVDLLTEKWADEFGYDLKFMTPLNLVLCPVCSEIYRDYVQKDIEKQTALFEHLVNGENDDFAVCDADVRKDQKDRVLHFNQTHLGDIQDCLDASDDSTLDGD